MIRVENSIGINRLKSGYQFTVFNFLVDGGLRLTKMLKGLDTRKLQKKFWNLRRRTK